MSKTPGLRCETSGGSMKDASTALEPTEHGSAAGSDRSFSGSGPPIALACHCKTPKQLIWVKAQAAFSTIAQQLGMSTNVPVITMDLSCALETLSFCADSSTTLTKGFQPFNLVPAWFSFQVQEAAATTTDYNHISSGGALVQYADIQTIQGRQSYCCPVPHLG